MKEPKIRFKGFSGEWKMPKLGDVFEIRNGYTPSKQSVLFGQMELYHGSEWKTSEIKVAY